MDGVRCGLDPLCGTHAGGIIGLASLNSSVGQGGVLLVAYAMGLGIPFILVAVGASAANRRLAWFRKHEAGVSLVTGS
jgi:cytochrome c-type biogenesis protein